jgi:NitT/TauT family transport system ATP-binding protein
MYTDNHHFLKVIGLNRSFPVNGSEQTVLCNVDMFCSEGELVCILGPSGCGKTTLLNIIAGFLNPTDGSVILDGKPLGPPGPDRCFVFQEDALFPWLTVSENVAFGLQARKLNKREVTERVNGILEIVGLERYGSYLPREISGGMKQRVSLARVLVLEPRLLLMDEPFASLDSKTRQEMHALLLDLWRKLNRTIIFVTHDVEEALILADTIYVLNINPGSIRERIQVSLPRSRDPESPEFIKEKKKLSECVMGGKDFCGC